MRVTLRIKEKYLKEILSLTKKEEYRDFKPYYISRFCEKVDGEYTEFKPIKEVCLIAGYAAKAPRAIVEVEEIAVEQYVDDFDKPVEEYYFVLFLGKVLEKKFID